MKLISIVIPVLNEQANVARVYQRLSAIMAQLADRYDYEVLFTDNHSSDDTFAAIQALAQLDPRVRCVRFSTNFGYQRSILTGYLLSSGQAVIQLDADLEDPPELIPQFLSYWEKGFYVVYGIRRSRQESKAKTLSRWIFYRIINALSETALPLDAGDFRLLDRRIVQELGRSRDAHPYLRGTIAGIGFNQIGIPYDRERRIGGTSKFHFRSNLQLARDGILNHSVKPLRLASVMAVFSFLCALALGIVYVAGKVFLAEAFPPGFATLAVLLLLNTSLNAMFFGILGEYIGMIFRQTKTQPLTIIEKTINFNNPPEAIP